MSVLLNDKFWVLKEFSVDENAKMILRKRRRRRRRVIDKMYLEKIIKKK